MRCRCPKPLKVVRFVKGFLPFNQLNISRADIPCVLKNDVREAAPSTKPVTLYITVNITPSNLYHSPQCPPSMPTEDDGSPAEEATIPGRIQFPVPEHLLPLSHHQPVETCDTSPQSLEEMPPISAKNPRLALRQADEDVRRIIPTNRSNTWERAVRRIKWVIDMLGPIAEVRVMPFYVLD